MVEIDSHMIEIDSHTIELESHIVVAGLLGPTGCDPHLRGQQKTGWWAECAVEQLCVGFGCIRFKSTIQCNKPPSMPKFRNVDDEADVVTAPTGDKQEPPARHDDSDFGKGDEKAAAALESLTPRSRSHLDPIVAKISDTHQRLVSLRQLLASMSANSRCFQAQELAVVESRIIKYESRAQELATCLQQKLVIYQTEMDQLKGILCDRCRVLSQFDDFISTEPEVGQVFVDFHQQLECKLSEMEAKFRG